MTTAVIDLADIFITVVHIVVIIITVVVMVIELQPLQPVMSLKLVKYLVNIIQQTARLTLQRHLATYRLYTRYV